MIGHRVIGAYRDDAPLSDQVSFGKKVLLAVAHKLLKVLLAMLTTKSHFQKGVVQV